MKPCISTHFDKINLFWPNITFPNGWSGGWVAEMIPAQLKLGLGFSHDYNIQVWLELYFCQVNI